MPQIVDSDFYKLGKEKWTEGAHVNGVGELLKGTHLFIFFLGLGFLRQPPEPAHRGSHLPLPVSASACSCGKSSRLQGFHLHSHVW